MTETTSRQPQGIPAGGQFTPTSHAEPDILLVGRLGDAPPARTLCVLAVPADNRKGVDPETLARSFRQYGQYTDPEWADEDEDTGQKIWEAVHTRLVSDLGVPAS